MKKLVLIIFLASCGRAPGFMTQREEAALLNVDPAQAENYSYEFSTTKCSTGVHSFDTFANACEALKNHELNNSCAEDLREELFVSELCPGEFTS